MNKKSIAVAVFFFVSSLLSATWGCFTPPNAELELGRTHYIQNRNVHMTGENSSVQMGGMPLVEWGWDFDFSGVVPDDYQDDYFEYDLYYPDGSFDKRTFHNYGNTGIYNIVMRVTGSRETSGYDGGSPAITIEISEDSDSDNMPDQWEKDSWDNDSDIVANIAWNGDGDDSPDGYSNLCEYLHNTDPSDGSSTPTGGIRIYVPDDVDSIQIAIDASLDGDTIVVLPNIYNEVIDFKGKAITIESVDPDDWSVVETTIIDGQNLSSPVVSFQTSETNTSILRGITITKGEDSGVLCDATDPIIEKCIINNNSSGTNNDGGGIALYSSGAEISHCYIYGNVSSQDGGGLYLYTGQPGTDPEPSISTCVIYDNSAANGGAIYNDSSSPTIHRCTIVNNEATSAGGAMYSTGSSSEPAVQSTIFWGNTATTENTIFNNSAVPTFQYSNIQDCLDGGSWDTDYGTNTAGNKDQNPAFENIDSLKGADGILGNSHDGLCLKSTSPLIDVGYETDVHALDIRGLEENDVYYITSVGGGTVNYIDMGAYESKTIWYVDKEAQGNNDGSSWGDAFVDLQSALDGTTETKDIRDEIWVAKGLYIPDATERTISYEIPSSVYVYGGFDGTESILSERDWIENQSILSGDINMIGVHPDNSYTIVILNGSSVLNGFIIEKGYRGIKIDTYSIGSTIKNCIIRDNYGGSSGGGLYIVHSSLCLQNSVITNNHATYGGGIYLYGKSRLNMQNCILCNNSAGNNGGALYAYTYSGDLLYLKRKNNYIFLKNNTFVSNTAYDYAGAISITKGKLFGSNNILWNNTAENNDDPIYISESEVKWDYSNLENCKNESGTWDASFGENVAGNIDSEPFFVNMDDPDGLDDTFFTEDDGLRIRTCSPSVDTANGDEAPEKDILQQSRTDISSVTNGTGTPNYADMGAYEAYETDSDGDGLDNLDEYYYGTDLEDIDTDDDGLIDGYDGHILTTEYASGVNSDQDNYVDGEMDFGTDPLLADMDEDGLTDGEEIGTYETDPTKKDSDSDGLTDYYEVTVSYEGGFYTDPTDDDSDNDGLKDGEEVILYYTDPLDEDSDDDNLTDGDEILIHDTDPFDRDSDDDGINDYDEFYTSFPFITSFESYQEYEEGDINGVHGWSVYGSVVEDVVTVEKATCKDTENVDCPYHYVNLSSDTILSKTFTTDGTNNSVVRISCVPGDDSYIHLKNGISTVASLYFDGTNDCIKVWSGGSYVTLANSAYSGIKDSCEDYLDAALADPVAQPIADYSKTWINFKITLDWQNDQYSIDWDYWDIPSGLRVSSTLISNAAFDASYSGFSTVAFETLSSGTEPEFNLNRISVTDKTDAGGVINNTLGATSGDIYISTPQPVFLEPLEGFNEIEGSVWYENMGQYKIKCCPTDVDSSESENWMLVHQACRVVDSDLIGCWDASQFYNGNYYLKIELYDDLNQKLDEEVIQTSISPNGHTSDVDVRYSIAGRLKGQSFHYEEVPDITINWPGQFPFEFKRIYDSNLRSQLYPMFFGWTHNHNIRLFEDTSFNWEEDASSVAIEDSASVGMGAIYLQIAGGSRMFLLDETQLPQKVIYKPRDNEPDYIIRTSSSDTSTNPDTVSLSYTHYAADGTTMEFSVTDHALPHDIPASEGVVGWTVNLGIEQKTDRFGNALLYTWLKDDQTNMPYLSEISNNCTDMKLIFETEDRADYEAIYEGYDLYKKIILSDGNTDRDIIIFAIEWYTVDSFVYRVYKYSDNDIENADIAYYSYTIIDDIPLMNRFCYNAPYYIDSSCCGKPEI